MDSQGSDDDFVLPNNLINSNSDAQYTVDTIQIPQSVLDHLKENDFLKKGQEYVGIHAIDGDFLDATKQIVEQLERKENSSYYIRVTRPSRSDKFKVWHTINRHQIQATDATKQLRSRTWHCRKDFRVKKAYTKKEGEHSRTSCGTIKASLPEQGCPAKIHCVELCNEKDEKFVVSIIFPYHSHELHGYTQNVHKIVKDLLAIYVREGYRMTLNINDLRDRLRGDIISNLGEQEYSEEKRAINPSKKDIENIVRSLKQRGTKTDQHHLKDIADQYKEEGHFVYFMPYRNQETGNPTDFCFVFLGKQQKKLLEQFGALVLLDATYKTCRYRFNLFNIIVPTPYRHMVVGFFITQDEMGDTISACLGRIKSWAPDWEPVIFWVDQDAAEQRAIMDTFPNCALKLCEFHFKVDWRKKLGIDLKLPPVEVDAIYDGLCKVVYAKTPNPTEDVAIDHYMMAEAKKLVNSVFVKKYPDVISYIERYLGFREMWGNCYRSSVPSNGITTTNAVEGYHSNLKKHYLIRKNILVSTLVETIVDHVFKDYWADFVDKVRASSKHYRTRTELPDLSDCSNTVYKHCLSSYNKKVDPVNCTYKENGVWWVRSSHVTFQYEVTLREDKTWCTCTDFMKYRLICKHMWCAAENSLDNLPKSYMNCAEYNASVQNSTEKRLSVIRFTETQRQAAGSSSVLDLLGTVDEEPTTNVDQTLDFVPSENGNIPSSDDVHSSVVIEDVPETSNIPSRADINRKNRHKRTINECHQLLKSLSSLVYQSRPQRAEELKKKLQDLVKDFSKDAIEDLDDTMPLSREFTVSDPSVACGKNRGRPKSSGKERKKIKRQ